MCVRFLVFEILSNVRNFRSKFYLLNNKFYYFRISDIYFFSAVIKITISNGKICYQNNNNYYLKSNIWYENLKNDYLKSKNPRCRKCSSAPQHNNKFSYKKKFKNKFFSVIQFLFNGSSRSSSTVECDSS